MDRTGAHQVAVFPAYAGMSLTGGGSGQNDRGFPRLRGDEPGGYARNGVVLMFSPPTRG